MTRRRRLALLLFCAASTCTVGLSACTATVQSLTDTLMTPWNTPNKPRQSPLDERDYKFFTLPNGMRVLVVSDPQSTKAAAALHVHAGSAANPKRWQGLAHLVEHMLFLGTEKYPDASAYPAFINAHGGSTNAYTAFEFTSYFFDVSAGQLEPALDRFAQFFVAPLFNRDSLGREQAVVESEYRSRFRNGERRLVDVLSQLVNPAHPWSKFTVGAREIFEQDSPAVLHDAVVDFYRRHYAPQRMTLAVVGRESTAELEQLATHYFAPVPQRTVAPAPEREVLFTPGTLPRQLDIIPFRDTRQLRLLFPLPSLYAHYRSKPLGYIGHLVGHESEGSLLSYLKQRNWASGLFSGLSFHHDDGAMFSVRIDLTEEGLREYTAVAEAVFRYLALLRETGFRKDIFREQARIKALRFRFQEKQPAADYADQLAFALRYYPLEDVLHAAYRMDRPDAALVAKMLSYMQPDKCLLMRIAKDLPTDQRTYWFETPYQVRPIEDAVLAAWRKPKRIDPLAMPAPNPFLPENLELLPPPAEHTDKPVLLYDTDSFRFWNGYDGHFKVPKSTLRVRIHTPLAGDTPAHAVMSAWHLALVEENLTAYQYQASLADLQLQWTRGIGSFTLSVSGYRDNQQAFVQRVLQSFLAPKIEADSFARVRENALRIWRNQRQAAPYLRTYEGVLETLVHDQWQFEELITAAESLRQRDQQRFSRRLLKQFSVDALFFGNHSTADARRLAEDLQQLFSAQLAPRSSSRTPIRVVRLDAGRHFLAPVRTQHKDAVAGLYLQAADEQFSSKALISMTRQIANQEFFRRLRTEQKLGYIVFLGNVRAHRLPGLLFLVQSDSQQGPALEKFIYAFLGAADSVPGDADSFAQHRASLLSLLRKPPETLEEKAARYWHDLVLDYPQFDYRSRLIAAVEALEYPEWRAFYDSMGDNLGSILFRTATGHGGPSATETAVAPPPVEPPARRNINDTRAFQRNTPALRWH